MTVHRQDDLDSYLDMWGQLFVCLLIDAVGMINVIPGIGEAVGIPDGLFEMLWIYFMLNSSSVPAGAWATFGFVEEVIPVVAVIPGCTLAWIYKYQFRG